jgi:CSLREA domain-containing protein
MRIHRRSTYTRAGRRRIAPVAVSLVSGLALVGGFTLASAVNAAPTGAATAHASLQAPTPQTVNQAGHPLQTDNSTHLGQTPPSAGSTPHVLPHAAVNQTFTVNTQNDTNLQTPGSTSCVDTDGNCSLRAAVEAANNDAPNVDAINVPAGYDILLNSGFGAITVNTSMFISGLSGGAAPVVDGQHATEVFDIYSNSTSVNPAVQIGNMTIQNGSSSDGGDIYLGDYTADLTLSSVSVTGGTADYGGGIYVTTGAALWTDSGTSITNNTAGTCGGGILADGLVQVSGSTISGNSAGCGGGIDNEGALSLDAAQINNNSAESGGAILNDYSLTDNGSSYNGNSAGTSTSLASTAQGAVLANWDAANLTNVNVSGSQSWSASETDGGVFFNAWALSLNNVSVSNTTNRSDGEYIYGGVVANEADQGDGTYNGTLSVNGLTVSGTSNGTGGVDTYVYGGVIYNDYQASVTGLSASSTNNNVGGDELFGGVGDVDFTIDCCPTEYNGVTAYNDVTVSGTSNTGTGDAYLQGGVFDVGYDIYAGPGNPGPGDALSGNITGGTISGTTNTGGTNEIDGGSVASESPIALSNVSVDSTTVNLSGGSVYGGAVDTIRDAGPFFTSYPETTANNVSVTKTSVTNIGGGHGLITGGAWYNTDELNATNLQILDTSVTADSATFGGAFANGVFFQNDGDVSNLTDSTISRTNSTMPTGGAVGVMFIDAPANLINVTLDDNTTSGSEFADTIGTEEPLSMTNVTMANNNVTPGVGDGIYSAGGVTHFKNTIMETNGGPSCVSGPPTETFVSDGGNIEGGGDTCNFEMPSDQNNVANVGVNPTTNNSGPVETAALQPGSPAIGRGVSAGCPSTDARGVVRPAGNCDVGAFQLSKQGYWMVASDGGIFNFANAGFFGSMGGTALNSPIVGMAVTPDGKGYWQVAADGGIFNFGDAAYYGSMGGKHINKPIVGMAATSDGKGYWLVASDGGIFSFGDAHFFGSAGAIHLNKPVVGMAATPGGGGYWLVASDGGIFTYGPSANFFGSAGSLTLNKPVVGMAAAPGGNGYWLVASDGGIFTYGPGAAFYGSTGAIHLNKPVVGMAASASGDGYWLFASDGGVFNYGDATFQGSMGGTPLVQPVVGGAANSID